MLSEASPVEKILIVDDDVAVTNYLMVFLMQTEIYEPTVVNDSNEVPGLLERESFDAILLDIDMPGLSGIDILEVVGERQLTVPVIVLSGVNDVDLAVKSMKLGAFDYLTKPVEGDHLLAVLKAAIKHRSVTNVTREPEAALAREDLDHQEAFETLPTQDPTMIRIFHQAEKMAAGNLSVFIWGERGTGKESLARAIHRASPRRDHPFVAIDIAAIEPESLAAEIFGEAENFSGGREERRGFLEQAAGGMLFLDEVDRLTLPVQHRLLRVIQKGEYYKEGSAQIRIIDVRFVVASHLDMASEETKDLFYSDLLYHLLVNSLNPPPLRERVEDIPLIARRFLELAAGEAGKSIKGFSDDYLQLLKTFRFPNNLQDLKNIVASSVLSTEGDIVTVKSLTLGQVALMS